MKYIISLTPSEQITLEEAFKNHPSSRTRSRAHALLLSHRHFLIDELAKIFFSDRDTISHWLDEWETYGIVGLFDAPRTGRPCKLTEKEKQKVKEWTQLHPRSIKTVAAEVFKHFGKVVSLDTIKRIIKGFHFTSKRIRKSLKRKRNAEAFAQMATEIQELKELESAGLIQLYFFDESGFSLQPVVPYAWQPKGEVLELFSTKSEYLSVLGFLNLHKKLESYIVRGSVDSAMVIECFNAFSEHLTKPTYVILDNAPQHTSMAFKAKISEWKKKKLFIYYLPPYSPELNLIEILWRFIKYAWLPFSAYLNFDSLNHALEEVLKNFGTKYQINFA